MGQVRISYTILLGILMLRNLLEELSVGGRIILIRFLRNMVGGCGLDSSDIRLVLMIS